MTRTLFDTDVALDWLLDREPWFSEGADFWPLIDTGRVTPFLAAVSITNIHYIVRRHTDRDRALTVVRTAPIAFVICPVDACTLAQALELPGSDFEDRVQIACAQQSRVELS